MKRLAIALFAVTGLNGYCQIASAADLPMKAPPMIAAPMPFTWTGFYVGGNAGYAWGNSNVSTTVVTGSYLDVPSDLNQINSLSPVKLHPNGFVGGVQGGYNYQSGNTVFGLEVDFQAFNTSASRDVSNLYPNPAQQVPARYNLHQDVHTNWLFTARPRLGWASDHWLLYVTGGLAVTDLKSSYTFSDNAGFNYLGTSTASATKAGWTLGGGVEYGLTRNWSIKAEYLYVDFGTVSANSLATANIGVCTPATCNNAFSHSADLRSNIVRAGINYRFN
jgi:outer membrane immunogenic protein